MALRSDFKCKPLKSLPSRRRKGRVRGKTLVSLVGVGLPVSSQAYCKFEEAGLYEREAGVSAVVYVPVLTANTGLVQCHAPPLVDFNLTTRSSSMLVSIEDISQNVSTNALLFEYIGDASILEIAPGRGSIDGGTEIRVTGYNFAFATLIVLPLWDG